MFNISRFNRIKYTTVFGKQIFIKDKELFHLHQSKCDTKLSKGLGRLKARGNYPVVTWKNLPSAYNINRRKRSLCLNKKLKMDLYGVNNMLKKGTAIINKCRHQKKFVFGCYDSKM